MNRYKIALIQAQRRAEEEHKKKELVRRLVCVSVIAIVIGLLLVLGGCATLSTKELRAQAEACATELGLQEAWKQQQQGGEIVGTTEAMCKVEFPLPDVTECYVKVKERETATERHRARRINAQQCCTDPWGKPVSGRCGCVSGFQLDEFLLQN